MAVVWRDPVLLETQMLPIYREAYGKLLKLCAESGCSSNGHLGDKCLFFIDSCSYSNVRAWGQPAFRDIRTPRYPYPYGYPPVSPDHSAVALAEHPTGWGISIAAIIARWPEVPMPRYHSIPLSIEFDACIYRFTLNPWIRDHIFCAVAFKCHGKSMSMAYFLRHVAVNMFYAVRDKITGLSELDVFKLLIHVHLRQLVVTGFSREEKLVFVDVIWAEASLM